MVYIPNKELTSIQQIKLHRINIHTPRRQMITLLLIISCLSRGVAFTNTHIPRLRQPPPTQSPHLTVKSIPSKSIASAPPTGQLSMLPRKVLLDILDHVTTPTSKKDGTTTITTNPATLGKVLPLALITKAFTTPTAAFGLSGTTMVTTTAAAAGSLFNSHATSTDTITVETQVLNDMSHIGIDLASFFIPSLLLLRIAAIIGRVCTITADYIPDHVIVPEEFVFQMAMLCFACAGLLKSALIPAAASIYNATSVKDGRAYGSIFQPAGTSWSQYKALSVCGALEWVTLQAGDTIKVSSTGNSDEDNEGEDYMYWLYSGDAVVTTNGGEQVYAISSGKKTTSSAHRGLLGEQRLIQRLSKIPKPKTARSNGTSTNVASDNQVAITSPTAIMLRISTQRLHMLMELDPTLAESMRNMIFQGMEAKLHAQVQETTNLLKSFNITSTSGIVNA